MAGRRRRAYRPLMKLTRKLLGRARQLLREAQMAWWVHEAEPSDSHWLAAAVGTLRGVDGEGAEQTHRRVVLGESVPNAEKIFSIFEPHTELINRGKTPQPVEFGHRVLVLEDQVGFMVHYQVLDNGVQDKDVAVSSLRAAQRPGG